MTPGTKTKTHWQLKSARSAEKMQQCFNIYPQTYPSCRNVTRHLWNLIRKIYIYYYIKKIYWNPRSVVFQWSKLNLIKLNRWSPFISIQFLQHRSRDQREHQGLRATDAQWDSYDVKSSSSLTPSPPPPLPLHLSIDRLVLFSLPLWDNHHTLIIPNSHYSTVQTKPEWGATAAADWLKSAAWGPDEPGPLNNSSNEPKDISPPNVITISY